MRIIFVLRITDTVGLKQTERKFAAFAKFHPDGGLAAEKLFLIRIECRQVK